MGFQDYADDDTPRDAAWAPRRNSEPGVWVVPPPLSTEPHRAAPAQSRPGPLWPKLAVGAAVAAAFGGGYLLARSDTEPSAIQRPTSDAAAMAAARPMNVEVAAIAPPAPPPVSSGGKLEVLPRSTGPVAMFIPRPAPSPAPATAREAPLLSLPSRPASSPPAAPAAREVAEAPTPRDAVAVAPAPAPAPASFACRDAPSRARAMVCEDRGLATLDRRMKQAYAAAVAAGTPRDMLAEDQDDWLEVREEAATYSRRAVADIYRQRIGELEAMADRR